MIETCTAHDHPPCNSCGRPMRVRPETIADHPGTLAQRRAGTCNSCAYAQDQGRPASNLGPKFTIGTPCTVCNRPMRPKKKFAADAPGTTEGHNRFICRRDKDRYTKAGIPLPTETTTAPTKAEATSATVTALDSYINNRRRRGIPTTGLRRSTAA